MLPIAARLPASQIRRLALPREPGSQAGFWVSKNKPPHATTTDSAQHGASPGAEGASASRCLWIARWPLTSAEACGGAVAEKTSIPPRTTREGPIVSPHVRFVVEEAYLGCLATRGCKCVRRQGRRGSPCLHGLETSSSTHAYFLRPPIGVDLCREILKGRAGNLGCLHCGTVGIGTTDAVLTLHWLVGW